MKNIAISSLLLAQITVVGADLTAKTPDPDLGDHPEFAHAMKVETKTVDGLPVVFHYGQVRPDFDNLAEDSVRRTDKLSGSWMFRFDPKGLGQQQGWFNPESDVKNWKVVTVPHCWDAMPGGRYWDWNDRSENNPPHYDGAAWYQKTWVYQPNEGKHQRVVFLGVQQRARIYLNGQQIAQHEGGGAPFSVDVTQHIKAGNNTLALKVIRLPNFRKKADGKGWHEIDYVHTMHPKAPDCWPYAGILRDVFIVEESPVTIRKTLVDAKKGGLQSAIIISNHSDSEREVRVKMTHTIDPLSSKKTAFFSMAPNTTVVKKIAVGGIGSKTKLWTVSSPQLYEAKFSLEDKAGSVIDQLSTRFGIRSFVTDGSFFKLNGRKWFLKGASIYEEHPLRGGALTPEDHRDYFERLRDSKSNFARLHVIQRDPYAYQVANETGIMVCGEWGGFWYKEKSMKAQTEDPHSIYQTMARCAVWDLMNHPSVVLWGLNNECHQFCPEYEPFLKTSRELVRELDFQKRPITWSAWHPHMGEPHFEHADAVGFNEYRGAMDPFEKLDPDLKKAIKQNPNKPIIIMENGAWSKRGSRGRVTQKGNENWQADLLKRQWEVLSKHSPPFSGYTYWLLQDYRSRKPYTGKKSSNGYSRMGIYDEYGEPKILVREAFRNLPNPLLQDTR